MEWGTRNKEFAQVGLAIEAWQKYYKRNQQQYIRRRLDAIRLFWEGKPRGLIAQELAISYKTLSSYLDLYRQAGLEGLVNPIVKPRLRLLTDQQMEKVKDIVLHECPQAYSKKRNIWTLKLLVEVVRELFLVQLSIATMWYYLPRMQLSHQKAARYYLNQDKEEIRLFAHALIDALVNLPVGAKLIFIDEFSICTRPTTYYRWGQAGQQPQINSDEKKRARTNGFISVDAISGEINLWQSKQAKSEQVAEFCFRQAKQAYDQGFVSLTIVLDNNKTHLKKMKKTFNDQLIEAKLPIEVTFLYTARYAPTYNLAEYMISIIRRLILHHLPADFTLEQIGERMEQVLCQQIIQTKQQVWNTIDHILNTAILGNYSFKQL